MSNSDPIVIVGASRTPMGGFQGDFANARATDLGAAAIRGALAGAGLAPEAVEDVYMGCVLPAGQGTGSCASGLNQSRIAGFNRRDDGQQDVRLGHEGNHAGARSAAGKFCRCHRVRRHGEHDELPYLLPKARGGYRMGHGQIIDHMFLDGLEDAYDKGRLMGTFAEDCAEAYQFTREAQDEFAIASLTRAQNAITNGLFAAEITPVSVKAGRSEVEISIDEQPGKAKLEKIPTLRPAFRDGGTVTAANSSSISDGAAALVLMRASEAEKRGLTPRAVLVGHATHADKPNLYPTAPIGAINKLSAKIGWNLKDVDLFEINEAFAVVTMAAMRDLDLPHDKVNIHGGACAPGHPIGASGARILVTLLSALETHGLKRGVAGICLGGGEATAVGIERIV